MVIRGHFDGENIVLDEPIPEEVQPNTPVEVSFQAPKPTVFDELVKLARPCELPPDFAAQHEHYVKGGPRR
ncbi:MAG TPA: hypothetical protein PL151_12625 [Phycisphaerae bacterium]|nr:hypothetical protein [Phycisphaerae bacterium]HOJ74474.1 hypothetical protein [Phycisphaerae bacterium]HOM53329.1 hypothetical protein [Phycisphaerae bacterium]HON68868.1 hypothetical protein [Phycisphaerae bacterium]HOQ87106.1 hypothetical protein [Phycisphaerae bacterium]